MSLVTRLSVKRTFSINEQHTQVVFLPPAPEFGQGQPVAENHIINKRIRRLLEKSSTQSVVFVVKGWDVKALFIVVYSVTMSPFPVNS